METYNQSGNANDGSFTSIMCFTSEKSKSEFEFNFDKMGLTGELFINDFVTKRQYKVNLPGKIDELSWWYNVLCPSGCYSYYRKDNKIVLISPIDEHLKYIKTNKEGLSYISVITTWHNRNNEVCYYLLNGDKYLGKVVEIECTLLDKYDIMNINVETITNKFELRSIIYRLREEIQRDKDLQKEQKDKIKDIKEI